MSRSSRATRLALIGLALTVTLVGVLIASPPPAGEDDDTAGIPATTTTTSSITTTSTTTTSTTSTTTTTTTEPPYEGWVDPRSSGMPYGETVKGLLTFRGNPTRSYYGEGPVPTAPEIRWRFPDQAMCSNSSVGEQVINWCGTGWTGQPAIWERGEETWVAFGAYSRNVHVLDYDTGERLFPDFRTGDIIKGSVTIDPDGFPLLYTGSRDNDYRVIAFDRDELTELWALNAFDVSPTRWNNDWDGAGLILDDFLFIGGENSQFHVVKLNRGYDPDGLVTVEPELVFNTPGWDDELLRDVGGNVSIESSVAISGNVVYFANSGGLIQGWDITDLANGGEPTQVFRYWAGDDIDATLVIDDEGMIYAGVEYERGNARSREVGQIIKLDPTKDPEEALLWGVEQRPRLDSGIWATPGLHDDLLIVPTDSGDVLGLDRFSGEERWRVELSGPTWASPVIVDNIWIQGDCGGRLHAFDISDSTIEPPKLWEIDLGGCIESTPALWRGQIVVGTRAGFVYAIGDPLG